MKRYKYTILKIKIVYCLMNYTRVCTNRNECTLSDEEIFSIITKKDPEYLLWFVNMHIWLDEWVKNRMSKINYIHILKTDEQVIKFCNEYYNKYITDKIVLHVTLFDILWHGYGKIFNLKPLNIP